MPGFRHSPLDDIQRIRQDLRDRYQDGFPILKELLQNADDAGAATPGGSASQLVLVLARSGLPGARHPLLQTPGLAVLNDGAFTASDAVSITSLGMSNKAGQAGAAGKFGLGLKSIFHWAEAFFYFSPHQFTGAGRQQVAPYDLLNPWWSRESAVGRHQDWEETWHTSRQTDLAAFRELAQQVLGASRWFGLWIPLRREDHLRDEKGEIKPIEHRSPEPDFDCLFGEDWRTRLVETLPLLRRLRIVRVCERDGSTHSERWRFDLEAGARRMRYGLDGDANPLPFRQTLSGKVQASPLPTRPCTFSGIEQTQTLPSLESLKKRPAWPTQTGIGEDGGDRQEPEKAASHGAVVFTRQPADDKGNVRVQHAVFLPLGEPEELACKVPWRYGLFLHGFFFVDSGRRHIQLFDDLPEDMTPQKASTESELVKLWNRTLLREVVAPLVLPALDAFVRQESLAAEEVEALVDAMRKAEKLKPLKRWMCQGQRFVYRLRPGGGGWEHETWDVENGRPNRWLKLPQPGFPEPELFDLFPNLKALCDRATVSLEGKPALADDKPGKPDDSELAGLLKNVPISVFDQADRLGYLLDLIPEDASRREPDSELVKALVQLANQLLSRALPGDKDLAANWREFFKRLPAKVLVRLPVESSEADPAVKQALARHDLPVALAWEDWREAKGEGVIAWSDLSALLPGLGRLALRDGKGIQQRSDIAVRLLEACRDRPASWPGELARLPVLACRRADLELVAASQAELQQARNENRLFTSGESWAKDLAKAAPEFEAVFVESSVAKVLHLSEAACDATACVQLLKTAERLAGEFACRRPLFERLLPGARHNSERWRALRCLLHGHLAGWDSEAALFSAPRQTDAFAKLAELALKAAGQSWRLIPYQIAGQLRLDDRQKQSLNLREIYASTVEELVKELGPENVDCVHLTPDDCDTILLQFNDVDVLCGLNIHETLDGRRVRIEGHTYVDDGSFKELPEAFNQLVIRIRKRAGYARFEKPDGSNRLVNSLNWEAVIKIALAQPQPEQWWETILTAIGRLGTLRAELRDRVREIAWLPRAAGGAVKPADLLHLAGAETELDRLPPEILSGKVPILRLTEAVRKHDRFETFALTVLPSPRESLDALAALLKPHPAWSTGLDGEWSDEEVDAWIKGLHDPPCRVPSLVPLVKAFSKDQALRALLPPFMAELDEPLDVAVYGEMLKRMGAKLRRGEPDLKHLEPLFDRYLRRIALLGARFLREVLRNDGVMLRSQSGQWKPARQLCWPIHGVSPADQVCREHATILEPLETESVAEMHADASDASDERFSEAWRRTPERLKKYFAPWRDRIATELVGAFLSVLGDGPEGRLRSLARNFAGHRTVDGIRDAIAERLPNVNASAFSEHRFACVIVEQEKLRTFSVVGDPIHVHVDRKAHTLLLGGGTKTLRRGPDSRSHWLHLVRISTDGTDVSGEDLSNMLRAATEQVLRQIFHIEHIDLAPLWEEWSRSSQLSIRIAQNRIVEVAQAFLRQIGAHHVPAVRAVLRKWDRADRRRAEAEEAGRTVPAEVEKKLRRLKDDLRALLAENSDVQKVTLESVRRKMREYQYGKESVPFELWQNADDAAVEAEILGHDEGLIAEKGCVFFVHDKALVCVHCGRLVNEFMTVDGRSMRHLGFDQDLEKMVIQSVSDKGVGQGMASVTGKFGLGFKSVFLVTDIPRVLSGSLDFSIRGGIYPMVLDPETKETLARVAQCVGGEHAHRCTVIALTAREGEDPEFMKVMEPVRQLAPFLVAFSRRLKRLQFGLRQVEAVVQWQPETIANGLEIGALCGFGNEIAHALLFSGCVEGDRIQLLLGLNADGFVPLPREVPTFWVTAPTRATPDYGFAVNGPFEPDVGRVQLALKSKRNEELADRLACVVAERLEALWRLSREDWDALLVKLGLASSVTQSSFAESLWEVLGRRFANKCSKSNTSEAATLARRILWQSEHGGLRRFYAECDALPTGLWAEHHTLTRLGEIRFATDGALEREKVFRIASQWPSFRQQIRPGQLVSGHRVADVLRQWAALPTEPKPLHLATVVEWELQQGEELRADPETAARLGQLVTPEFLKALKDGESEERQEEEYAELKQLLPDVLFQAANGSWRKPAELVVADREGVDEDERMRAAFAPAECRLHPDYTGMALGFFFACRAELKADAETLATWVLQAEDTEMRAASLRYLLRGRLANELGEALRSHK
ncbi:MAG: hypothetical protein D6766_13135, partial [Verrucomicrobia bacterium]